MTQVTTTWGKHEVILHWLAIEDLPKDAVITTAHGICFSDPEHILLVNLDTRGWDFPGGHMEGSETPEECFLREAMEEACISGDLTLIGYVAVDNRNDNFWDSSMYPAIGYQAYYRMDITEFHPFLQDFESSERNTFAVSDVKVIHQRWNDLYETILETALNVREEIAQ